MSITVYTKDGCGPCATLKKWLQIKNVEYVEKNVGADPKYLEEMVEKTGMMSVPQTVADDKVVTGPNFALLSSILML